MRKISFETFVLALFLSLGLIAALIAAGDRYRVEMRNRRVELALDYQEVRALAAMNDVPLTALLSKFRQLGVSGLAINEDTVANLEQAGAIQVRWTPGGTHIKVLDRSGVTAKRLSTAIYDHDISILPASDANSPDFIIISTPGEKPYSIQLDYTDFRQMGIGLSPTALAVSRSSGLTPAARISNFPGVNEIAIDRTLGQLESEGVRTVIFIGDEVLGFNGLEATDTADLLRKHNINFGDIEFGKQKGTETLAIAMHGRLVRVHSITAAEMGTMSEQAAIERFTLAARERNIRLCYIRLLTDAGHKAIAKDEQYIAKIAHSISHHGQMSFGPARPFQKTNVPPPLFGLMAWGVAAGLVLLLRRLWGLPTGAAFAWLAVTGLLLGGVAIGMGETGRKLVALTAALTFPTLACARADLFGSTPAAIMSRWHAASTAVKGLAQASLVTAGGIVMVVGLLATRPFMVKVNQFTGIKAALALPVLLIGLIAITGLPDLSQTIDAARQKMIRKLTDLFYEPIPIGYFCLVLIGVAALGFVLLRSGNEGGIGVTAIELKLRLILERLLPERPRTKEFLVGHPAFVLALALWYRRRSKVALPLFVVGTLGQVSILNTFCHIHTPLTVSFIRDALGLIMGAIVGLALFVLVELIANSPFWRKLGFIGKVTA